MLHPLPLPGYRFRTNRLSEQGRIATRAVARNPPKDYASEVELAVNNGVYCDLETAAPIPGQRRFAIGEYLGRRLHRDPRYGGTVTISYEHARIDLPVKTWARSKCQSESARGYVFSAQAWEDLAPTEIDVMRLPEWDDPRPSVRNLARAERLRRILATRLAAADQERDEAIALTKRTMTRREAADLLDLSAARVQQLVRRARMKGYG